MNKTPFGRLTLLMLFAFTVSLPAVAQDTQRQYLSGHGKDDAVPWKFLCTTGALSGFWTNLPVPSNWELHGFGTLNYKKDSTNAWDERGLYERDFTLPASWSNQRVFLVFDGVMTDTSAKLNGESVGPAHQGGFYRFKYEVTKLLKFGATNRLEVSVAKHSANPSVNNAERLADYWVFGGIYRPVYLEAVPPEFIERVAIDALADGEFNLHVFVSGGTNTDLLEVQVNGPDDQPAEASFAGRLVGKENIIRKQFDDPLPWSAETPNLYRVEVRLKRGDQVLHRYQQRFGFRTMDVRDGDGLYVNGKRVFLKGANRHSFWPDSGRCLSEAVHRLDIETIKDMNMNAVRMSHYPPDEQFLDLCDELGLYVLDELAGWHKHYDTDVGKKLVEEMITRDVNHPSILFWDNGNEGGFNTNLDKVFGEFDPQQRRVLHPWASFNGLCTAHYLPFDKAEIAAEGQSVYYHDNHDIVATNDTTKYIYMPTEFMHGLFDGGAGAGLEDYWTLMRESELLGGGFIWALLDEGVKRPDTGKIDTATNQAPDGIVGPYREREGSFYTIKELWSPILVSPFGWPDNFTGVMIVENRYTFTDAKDCEFTWQLRNFRPPDESGSGYEVLEERKVDVRTIPPASTGEIQLELPPRWEQTDALALRVKDPTGRELWTWVWPLPAVERWQKMVNNSSRQAHFAGETTNSIEMKFESLLVTISKQTGLLSSVQRDGQTYSLTNGLRPAIGGFKLTSIATNSGGSDVIVTANYDGELKQIAWRLRSDGWLQCDYKYSASGTQDFCGVVFDYPERLVKNKRWLGDGPYRVWKNRLRGGTLNVWENDYNNTITGWADWKYPEFKGCFANVRWLQLGTSEGLITAVPGSSDIFVQVLTPELPPTNLVGKASAKLPQAGLAFLDAIPPIGSKFKEASTTGPQGQPNVADGEYSGSVNFYFGKLPQVSR